MLRTFGEGCLGGLGGAFGVSWGCLGGICDVLGILEALSSVIFSLSSLYLPLSSLIFPYLSLSSVICSFIFAYLTLSILFTKIVSAICSPVPTYTWKTIHSEGNEKTIVDGQDNILFVDGDPRILEIRSTTKSHAGKYICTATIGQKSDSMEWEIIYQGTDYPVFLHILLIYSYILIHIVISMVEIPHRNWDEMINNC